MWLVSTSWLWYLCVLCSSHALNLIFWDCYLLLCGTIPSKFLLLVSHVRAHRVLTDFGFIGFILRVLYVREYQACQEERETSRTIWIHGTKHCIGKLREKISRKRKWSKELFDHKEVKKEVKKESNGVHHTCVGTTSTVVRSLLAKLLTWSFVKMRPTFVRFVCRLNGSLLAGPTVVTMWLSRLWIAMYSRYQMPQYQRKFLLNATSSSATVLVPLSLWLGCATQNGGGTYGHMQSGGSKAQNIQLHFDNFLHWQSDTVRD